MTATQESLFGEEIVSTTKVMRRHLVSHEVFEGRGGGVIVINVKGWGNLSFCYGEDMKLKYRKAQPEDQEPTKEVVRFAGQQAWAVLMSHLKKAGVLES